MENITREQLIAEGWKEANYKPSGCPYVTDVLFKEFRTIGIRFCAIECWHGNNNPNRVYRIMRSSPFTDENKLFDLSEDGPLIEPVMFIGRIDSVDTLRVIEKCLYIDKIVRFES